MGGWAATRAQLRANSSCGIGKCNAGHHPPLARCYTKGTGLATIIGESGAETGADNALYSMKQLKVFSAANSVIVGWVFENSILQRAAIFGSYGNMLVHMRISGLRVVRRIR